MKKLFRHLMAVEYPVKMMMCASAVCKHSNSEDLQEMRSQETPTDEEMR